MSDHGWTGLMSPSGLRLDADPHRFDEWLPVEPAPRPVVEHVVKVGHEHERGDAGNGLWFVAFCDCGWSSCRYRRSAEAECAARLHDGAAAGVEQ